MQKRMAFLSSMILLFTVAAYAQMSGQKRPSPPAKTECKFSDGKSIHVAYSSPRAKGRKIYGGLVPYGQPWRTGANEATTFVNDVDVTIGGKTVPAGNYTMFTVPEQNKWTLIISKKTGEWGIPYPGKEFDFARVDLKKSSLDAPVEQFTLTLSKNGGACTLNIDWETTRASVEINESK